MYRRAGAALLSGGDIYHLPNSLPFLYPPFAALIAVPLSILPAVVVEIGWTVANVLALLMIMRRLGVHGWALSVLATAVIWFVEPVNQTLAYGQVGVFLVALVVVDLIPGGDGRRGRLTGALTGIAAAIKLTPGLFFLVLAAGRRWGAAIGVLVSFLVMTLVTAAVVPGVSLGYWTRLAHGDTGLGHSIIYTTNQSVLGAWLRWFGLGRLATFSGLAACGLVALLGVAAAVVWLRHGEPAMGVTLGRGGDVAGLPGLLVPPLRLDRAARSAAVRQPGGARVPRGRLRSSVVAAAPFKILPRGGDIELTYRWTQNLLASITPVPLSSCSCSACSPAGRRPDGRSH